MPQITPDHPILLVSGTNRPNSFALRVTQVLQQVYRQGGIACDLLALTELPPTLLMPEAYAHKPPEFVQIQQRVRAAAGLHLVAPEYNGGYPGVLKMFIDHLKVPESFEFRPYCLTGESTGPFGALRSVEQLTMVLTYRGAHVFPRRVYIPRVAEAFDADGAVRDPELSQRLARQAEEFAAFVSRL